MCIYCGTTKYRKIYEKHFGPIPKEGDGRSYEIHHIDGKKHNNDPSNLKCVTIQEHYDIHYLQGDWAACLRMSYRMGISPEEKSRLASNTAKNRINSKNYINPFSTRSDGTSVSSIRAAHGEHHYLKRSDGTSLSSDRVMLGTHNFITNHPNKLQTTCPHCRKTGGGTNMSRFHFDNCWQNPNKTEIKREVFICEYCNLATNRGNYSRWHGDNCKSLSEG